MSYSFYSFLHIVAIFVVTMSLTITCFQIINGANKAQIKNRKALSITHGIALLIVFIAGFGLIAKGGYSLSSSPWIYIKILCWFLLGIYPVILYKQLLPRKMSLYVLGAILVVAVYTVTFKPI